MKNIKKVLLWSFLIIVLVISLLLFWQRDNISALINGIKYSSDDLASQLDIKREDLKEQVSKYTNIPISDISAEDEEKLFTGKITIEEISEKYKFPLDEIDETKENEETNANNDLETNPTNADNSKAIDKAVSTGVSKMYALKAKYVSLLGELERSVVSEYSKLPKEEQNASNKKKIVAKNLNYIAEMEHKCDSEVADSLLKLEEKLKELKGDTEIVKILREAYENEKKIKKSYYLSIYNDKK